MTASGSPRLKAPTGACDTHMHFYDARYPTAPTAVSTAPDATVEDYRRVQARLGLTRTVVVQPSTYGFDNLPTLDGIAALGLEHARGVAVVDHEVTDAELEDLTARGVRGARFHMLGGGAVPWDRLDRISARVQSFGWHVQLQLDGRDLPGREAQIRAWPGQLVIDHTGKFLEPVTVDHPAFRCLAGLVETGRVWVKLSEPYAVSKEGPPGYGDVARLARELVRLAPERMLWATNWPHPGHAPQEEAALLDLLLDWAPDEATRRRILVDNPAALYGFRAPPLAGGVGVAGIELRLRGPPDPISIDASARLSALRPNHPHPPTPPARGSGVPSGVFDPLHGVLGDGDHLAHLVRHLDLRA